MPDSLDVLSSAGRDSRSRLRRVLAIVFVISSAGVIALTLRLPHVLKEKPPALMLLWSALAMFALALVIGGIFFWFVADRFRASANEFRRVQGIVQTATGAPAESFRWLTSVKPVHVIAVLAGVPIFVALVYLLTHWLAPTGTWWTPLAVIWAVAVLVAILLDRRNRRLRPSARPSLWRTLLNMSLWFVLITLLMRFDPRSMWPYIGRNGSLILITALCLGLPFIVWGFGLLPLWWIGRALSRADYETALRRVNMLLKLSPDNAGFMFLRGTVLLFAGRYAEAESALRESAEAAGISASASQSSTLANLGEALMLQGRYDEALTQFEAAVQIHAGWGRAYSGMAEVYLWRDTEPERALLLIDKALGRKLRTWVSRRLDRHVLAQMYADRAWALALLGRTGEFRVELEKAFKIAGHRFKPGIASIHYRAGRSFLALHDEAEAAEHFRRAQSLDSGSSGMQAGQALRGSS